MGFIQLPYGNGQKIYIDPEELYIKSEWINHERHAVIMPDMPANIIILFTTHIKKCLNIFMIWGIKW